MTRSSEFFRRKKRDLLALRQKLAPERTSLRRQIGKDSIIQAVCRKRFNIIQAVCRIGIKKHFENMRFSPDWLGTENKLFESQHLQVLEKRRQCHESEEIHLPYVRNIHILVARQTF